MLKAPPAVSFVQPLIARGAELRSVEPVVAYFCFYSAVQQVLDTKLHTTDSAVSDFATSILNELEEMKATGLQNEEAKSIFESDEASRAYVLNFAANVFAKVQGAVDRLSVTKATGVGFIAAATFLALEQVWGPVSPETTDKIKYAKYQAARILGAVKRGEDPNEQFRLEAQRAAESAESAENAENAENAQDAASSLQEDKTAPPRSGTPEAAEPASDNANTAGAADEPTRTEDARSAELELPAAPHDDPSNDLALPGPPKEDLDRDLALPGAPNDQPEGNVSPTLHPKHKPASAPPKPRKDPQPPVKPVSQATSAPGERRPSPAEIVKLAQTTSSAQKHAKYAISALNYDDIKTAVGELEAALSVLKLYESQQN